MTIAVASLSWHSTSPDWGFDAVPSLYLLYLCAFFRILWRLSTSYRVPPGRRGETVWSHFKTVWRPECFWSKIHFFKSSKMFLLPLRMCSLCADEGECFKTEVEQTYIMSSEIVHCLVRLSHKVTPLSYVKLDAFRIFGWESVFAWIVCHTAFIQSRSDAESNIWYSKVIFCLFAFQFCQTSCLWYKLYYLEILKSSY